jgi:hypothetical protein
MGGFMAFEEDRPSNILLGPTQLEGYSLSGKGNFPRITREEIDDRSKANILSKVLVVCQTGWFVTQCIARVAQRLPVTELEVVTLAFAVINLGIYWLWWHKPLDVDHPVRVYKRQGIDEAVVNAGPSDARGYDDDNFIKVGQVLSRSAEALSRLYSHCRL